MPLDGLAHCRVELDEEEKNMYPYQESNPESLVS
jgi:hypothetical protein